MVGMLLAGVLLVPGIATLWTAWQKFNLPVDPEPLVAVGHGVGRPGRQSQLRFILVRFRKHSGSLTRAAFLSARSDAIANVAIIAAGLIISKDGELGLRTEIVPGLQSSLALWQLSLGSELVFSGDAGDTQPSRASKTASARASSGTTAISGWATR